MDYLTDVKNIPLHKLSFAHMNTVYVENFFNYLQTERTCSASTRNQRLMAIRSFVKYSAGRNPANVALQAEISNVPTQKAPDKIVEFLSEKALKVLLSAPNHSRTIGIRDNFFMTLMYDTAARCGEMLNLRLHDFELDTPNPYVRLLGKGSKFRTVPLMEKTVRFIHFYANLFMSGKA